MMRKQPPSLEVGDGVDVGGAVGFGGLGDVGRGVGLGLGLPEVAVGLGVPVVVGTVVGRLDDGAGAVAVGSDDVDGEVGWDVELVGWEAGSTTAAPAGCVPVRLSVALGAGRLAVPLEALAMPQPSSSEVVVQPPPASPGNPPEAIASSLQLSPDQ